MLKIPAYPHSVSFMFSAFEELPIDVSVRKVECMGERDVTSDAVVVM